MVARGSCHGARFEIVGWFCAGYWRSAGPSERAIGFVEASLDGLPRASPEWTAPLFALDVVRGRPEAVRAEVLGRVVTRRRRARLPRPAPRLPTEPRMSTPEDLPALTDAARALLMAFSVADARQRIPSRCAMVSAMTLPLLALFVGHAHAAPNTEEVDAERCAEGERAACVRLSTAARIAWAASRLEAWRVGDMTGKLPSWQIEEADWAMGQACAHGDGLACVVAETSPPTCMRGDARACQRTLADARASGVLWPSVRRFPIVDRAGFFDNGAPWMLAGNALLLGPEAIPVQLLPAERDERPAVLALAQEGEHLVALLGRLVPNASWYALSLAESDGAAWTERDVLPPRGDRWDGNDARYQILPGPRMLAVFFDPSEQRSGFAIGAGDGAPARVLGRLNRELGQRVETIGRIRAVSARFPLSR